MRHEAGAGVRKTRPGDATDRPADALEAGKVSLHVLPKVILDTQTQGAANRRIFTHSSKR